MTKKATSSKKPVYWTEWAAKTTATWLKRTWLVLVGGLLVSFVSVSADSTYGSGLYGSCQYGSCGITVSSSNVSLNLAPVPGGSCSVQEDIVSVLTDNSDGYTLTANTLGPNTALISGSNTINASTATYGSPAVLSTNSWGYNLSSFPGSSFTGPLNNVSYSSLSGYYFAGMPGVSSPVTLTNTSSPADPAQNTDVWYGACVDVTQPIGTYTTQVTYTATTQP